MVNIEYLKIPKDRVGVTIGKNGKIKHQLEIITKTELKIDSETGNIAISSTEETEDPLAIWKARYMIKAIGRGFNPEIALRLDNEDLVNHLWKVAALCSIVWEDIIQIGIDYFFFLGQ